VRDFSLYWTARTTSWLGDGVMVVALPWQVYELSDSPVAMGVAGALQTGSIVAFVLFGGVASDRFDRRRVIIVSDLVRGLAAVGIGVLALTGEVALWHVWTMAVVFGVGQAFAGPAFGSIVPQLVSPDLLLQANSALSTVNPLARSFAGPALGGLVIAAFGTGAAFIVDAASFGLAAAAVSLVAARPPLLREAGGRRSVARDIRESLRYVRERAWLWGTLGWALLALPLTTAPYVVLLPLLVKNELGGDASDLGFVFAVGGAAGVLVALALAQAGVPRRHVTFMWAMFALGAIDVALYALTQAPWQAMLVSFVGQTGWFAGTIVWNTLFQRAVPSEILGRVRSVDWLVSIGLVPLSFAVVGPLAEWAGVREVLVACGLLALALTAAAYRLPGMRETEGRIRLSTV
jgi:MFS family permease